MGVRVGANPRFRNVAYRAHIVHSFIHSIYRDVCRIVFPAHSCLLQLRELYGNTAKAFMDTLADEKRQFWFRRATGTARNLEEETHHSARCFYRSAIRQKIAGERRGNGSTSGSLGSERERMRRSGRTFRIIRISGTSYRWPAVKEAAKGIERTGTGRNRER